MSLLKRTDGCSGGGEAGTAAFDELTSELLSGHQNVLDFVKGLQEQREQLNQETRAQRAGPLLQSLKKTFDVISKC